MRKNLIPLLLMLAFAGAVIGASPSDGDCDEPSWEDRLLACLQEATDGHIAVVCRHAFDDRFIAQLAEEEREKERLAELNPPGSGFYIDESLLKESDFVE